MDLSGQQAVAVLGLGLIAMGEDIGSEMLTRTLSHLMRYCEPVIRRAVPLALAMCSVSNPQLPILDTLSKFSHDADPEVAHNAIFGLGLLGAGTNNARLAAVLRQLAQYHAKDQNNLFMVRLAQGLVHLGKGTLTLNPFHSDRQLMSPVAVAGLLSVLVAFLDVKTTILGKHMTHHKTYILILLSFRQVPLSAVRTGHGHAAKDAGHIRRGAQPSARQCQGRPGCRCRRSGELKTLSVITFIFIALFSAGR